MNDKELECFLAVADSLSFSKAAQDLYYSVPTVTHQVQMLEQELGIDLFVRNKQMIHLTPEGMRFYSDAKRIIEDENYALRNIQNSRITTNLRIGCTASAEAMRLASVLKNLRAIKPGITYRICAREYRQLADMFNTNAIDFALGPSALAQDYNLNYYELNKIGYYILVNQQHPLASNTSCRFEEIVQWPLYILDSKRTPLDDENQLSVKVQEHLIHTHEGTVENEYDVLPLIMSGDDVFMLPENFVIPNYQSLGLALIPMSDSSAISYGIVYGNFRDEELM